LVVMSSFSWSDLGSWDELYRLSLKDARNNVIEGEVISINSSNSLIISNKNLICAVGIEDIIVVEGEDSLLICKRGQSEQVQELIEIMRKKQLKKYL
ncbi:MAG TPA: mannose-1-phosphate guanylyltransferase, partial [Candidatus Kapabacteria bacterium]|nr:mannose-1-phosphate guanylyltransferase [Candidatus Kapabacteria bacterium]